MPMAIAASMKSSNLLTCAGLLVLLQPVWISNVVAFTYPPQVASPSSSPSAPSLPPPLLPSLPSPSSPDEDGKDSSLVTPSVPSQPAPPPPSPPPPPPPPVNYISIWDFIVRNNLSTASLALAAALQVPVFNDSHLAVTIFLPSEKAYDKLSDALGISPTNRMGLLPYLTSIKRTLNYHMLPVKVSLQSVTDRYSQVGGTQYYETTLTMGQSSRIGVRVSGPTSPPAASPELTILAVSSTAQVLQADIVAGASFVNVVDTVLQYWYNTVDEAITSINGTSTMYQALKAANLLKPANVTSPYTIFVPTDDAFISAIGASAAATILANIGAYENLLRRHVAYGWAITDTPSEEYVRTSYITLNSNNVTVVVPSYDKASAGVKSTVASAAVPGSPPVIIVDTFQVGIKPDVIVHVINGVLSPASSRTTAGGAAVMVAPSSPLLLLLLMLAGLLLI